MTRYVVAALGALIVLVAFQMLMPDPPLIARGIAFAYLLLVGLGLMLVAVFNRFAKKPMTCDMCGGDLADIGTGLNCLDRVHYANAVRLGLDQMEPVAPEKRRGP